MPLKSVNKIFEISYFSNFYFCVRNNIIRFMALQIVPLQLFKSLFLIPIFQKLVFELLKKLLKSFELLKERLKNFELLKKRLKSFELLKEWLKSFALISIFDGYKAI